MFQNEITSREKSLNDSQLEKHVWYVNGHVSTKVLLLQGFILYILLVQSVSFNDVISVASYHKNPFLFNTFNTIKYTNVE